MRRDILIAAVGGSILIAGLAIFPLWREKVEMTREKKEIIYVDCGSFTTQTEAQEYFLENNATHLDGDKDGIACEELEPSQQPILRIVATSTPTTNVI